MASYDLKFLTGPKAKYAALESKSKFTFYLVNNEDNSQDLYLGGMKLSSAADLVAAVGDISEIQSTLETLQGAANVENSIRYLVKDAVDTLDNSLAAVAKSGNASDVAVADEGGNFEAATKNVESVLAEIASKISNASSNAAVTVAKTVGGEGDAFATKYVFSQGGTPITNGEITIAKDMVATSGELVTPTAENPITVNDQQVTSGTYIKMTIGNGDDFYINVADLIEYNTFTDTAADGEIVVTDSNHSISMRIGKVAASKIIYKEAADAIGEEGKDGYIPAQAEQTVAQAIAALEVASSTGVDGKIQTAIEDLDATVSQAAGADGLALEVTEVNGKLTGVTGSIAANTYDAYGAASTAKSEVVGTDQDIASANTIYGAKAYADAAVSVAVAWVDME